MGVGGVVTPLFRPAKRTTGLNLIRMCSQRYNSVNVPNSSRALASAPVGSASMV